MKRYIVNNGALLDEDMHMEHIGPRDPELECFVVVADEVVDAVVEAQADLQMALGYLRLEIRRIDDAIGYGDEPPESVEPLHDVEEKAAASLAKLHALLKDLGKEMA